VCFDLALTPESSNSTSHVLITSNRLPKTSTTVSTTSESSAQGTK